MKRILYFITFTIVSSWAIKAQNIDTIALFDFNNPSTTILTGTELDHAQTSHASTWNRIPGMSHLDSTEFLNNYSNYVAPYISADIRQYMDSAFMLMSMWDGSITGLRYNAWFELGPIDASQLDVVEIRMTQLYRKYYDTCFIDYTDALGEWHTMVINVLVVDVNVNSWGELYPHFVLPTNASHNPQLKIRFRWKNRDYGAAGYVWAIDNVAICRGKASALDQFADLYVEGAYGQIPHGMHLPISWKTQVKNSGLITQTGVNTSVIQLDSSLNQTNVVASVIQNDIPANNQLVNLFIEGQDNISQNGGWHGNSSYYGQTGMTDQNNGFSTDIIGKQFVYARVITDSLSLIYDTLLFKVTPKLPDSTFVWGHDNGLLLAGNSYQAGYVYNDTYNAWYITEASDNYNLAGYTVQNIYNTGSQIPLDANGNPWVIRGVEIVPAVNANSDQYVGAVLTAQVHESFFYNYDGTEYFNILSTGAAPYTVQQQDINNQFGLLTEGNYSSIRIMFPEQNVLEANKRYYIGYRLENNHEFAVASTGTTYIDSTGIRHNLKDNPQWKDYARVFPHSIYTTYVYDPTRNGTNFNYNPPMVRMLVGPRENNSTSHLVTINIDDNISGSWWGNGSVLDNSTTNYSVINGSSHSIYFSLSNPQGYIIELDTIIVSSATGTPRYHLVDEGEGYRLWLDSIVSDLSVSIYSNATINQTCHKNAPYRITRGDHWEYDCWFSSAGSLGNDSTVIQFNTDVISSPLITLPNNTDNYVISTTVLRPFTTNKMLSYIVTDTLRNVLFSETVAINSDSLTYMIPLTGVAGQKICFSIQVNENWNDYELFQLVDFAIFPFEGIANVTASSSSLYVGDTLYLSATTNDGQGNPADSYWWWSMDGNNQIYSSNAEAQFVWNNPGIYNINYNFTWNNYWNGYAVVLHGQIPIFVSVNPQYCDTVFPIPYDANFLQCWETGGNAQIENNNFARLTSSGDTLRSPWINITSDTVTLGLRLSRTDGEENRTYYRYNIVNPIGELLYSNTMYSTNWDNSLFLYGLAGQTVRVEIMHQDENDTTDLNLSKMALFSFPISVRIHGPNTVEMGQPATFSFDVNSPDNNALYYYWYTYDANYNYTYGYDSSFTAIWNEPGRHNVTLCFYKWMDNGFNASTSVNYIVTVLPNDSLSAIIVQLPYSANFAEGWELTGGAELLSDGRIKLNGYGQKATGPWMMVGIEGMGYWQYRMERDNANYNNPVHYMMSHCNYNGNRTSWSNEQLSDQFINPRYNEGTYNNGNIVRIEFEYTEEADTTPIYLSSLDYIQTICNLSIDGPDTVFVGRVAHFSSRGIVHHATEEEPATEPATPSYNWYYPSGEVGFNTVGVGNQESVDVYWDNPGTYRIGMIKNYANYYNGFYLTFQSDYHDVVVLEPCPIPNILMSNITDHGADVELNTNGQYEVQLRNISTSGAFESLSISNNDSLTGLAQSTTYQIRVRNICPETSDTSEWVSTQFTTLMSSSPIVYVAQQSIGIADGSSWDNATNDINYAISVAAARSATYGTPTSVWVAAGTYYGDTTSTNAFTAVNGVNVYGGFVGNEPENYDLTQRDIENNITKLDGRNQRRVLYQPSSFSTRTTWDGFTISGGHVANTSSYSYPYGHGAYLRDGIILSNCKVCNNDTVNDGYNHYGGGIYTTGSNSNNGVIIYKCDIFDNGNGTFSNGAGIYTTSFTSIINSRLRGNNSQQGALYTSGTTHVYNSLIDHNKSIYEGAGIYVSNYLHLINSTVVNNQITNSSTRSGGGIYCSPYNNNRLYLYNTVIWGNKGTSTANTDNVAGGYSVSQFTHSAIEGFTGDSLINLSSDNYGTDASQRYPSFINPESGDYRLHSTSALINNGTAINNLMPSYTPLTMFGFDFDGLERIFEDTIDIGCYEYHGEEHCLMLDGVITSNINENSAWIALISRNNENSSYEVEISTDGEIWAPYTTTTQTSFFVSGLNAATHYYVRIRSLCGEDSDTSQFVITAFTTTPVLTECEPIVIADNSMTTDSYLPTYTFYNYSYTQQLYTVEEMGNQSRSIDTIGFQYVSSSPYSRTVNIYLAHTNATTLSTGYLSGSILQLVYNGTIDFNNQGDDYWVNIALDTPFEYNGTDNLLVVMQDNSGWWQSGGSFYTHSTSTAMSRYAYRDNSPFDINNPPTGTSANYRNNIRFGGSCESTSSTCTRPNLAVSNISDHSVNLQLLTGTSFEMQIRPIGGEYIPIFVNTDFIINELKQNTTYQLRVRNICVPGDTSDWRSIRFTTLPSESPIVYVAQQAVGLADGSSWGNATNDINLAMDYAIARGSRYGTPATVWVASGTYYGDTTASNAFTMQPSVSVYGGFAGNEQESYDLSQRDFSTNVTILDGQNQRRVLNQSSSFNSSTAVVWDGFTIQHGHLSGSGAGVYLRAYSTLRNCIVKNNDASNKGGGIYASGTSYNYNDSNGIYHTAYTPVIEGCEITNNRAGSGAGTYLNYTNVVNSLIANNTATGNGGGVYTYYNSHIYNTTIVANAADAFGGIYSDGDIPDIYNSIIWHNTASNSKQFNDINLHFSAVSDATNDTSSIILSSSNTGLINSPRFVAPTEGSGYQYNGGDWHLSDSSICVGRGSNNLVYSETDLDGNARVQQETVDLGCYESPHVSVGEVPEYSDSIVYVTEVGAGLKDGTSWENAMSNLQDAINVASVHGYSVWVAEGTYYGDISQTNAFVIAEGVNVFGGFAGNEPANYDLSMRDFSIHQTILDGQQVQRVLYQPSNFSTLTICDGLTLQNGYLSNGDGAGAYFKSNVKLSNSIVRNNTVNSGKGGGIYSYSSSSNARVFIEKSQIMNNSASSGGGIYANYSNITNCRISGNSASNGAGTYFYSGNNSFNCIIDNNTTSSSNYGAVYSSSNSNVMEGCVVVNNTNPNGNGNGVGGVYNGYYNSLTLKNCIIWGNRKGNNASNIGGSSSIVSYSAIEGGYSNGTNIIDLSASNDGTDPTANYVRFIDPENGDYHLHATSPLIDAGDSTLTTQTTDYDGNIRIFGGNIDMGAFESDEVSACPPVVSVRLDSVGSFAAKLSWPPATGLRYLVQYGLHSAELADTVSGTDTTITLSGLTLNRSYSAKVRVICDSINTSLPSIPVNFTTVCDTTLLTPLSDITDLSPIDSSIAYSSDVTFTWTEMPEATSYDFYFWKEGDDEPTMPTRSHLSVATTTYSIPSFSNSRGTIFHWKVVAWNECISKSSEVMNLKVAYLPNLHVSAVNVTSNPMAGDSVNVEWTVTNDGQGSTPPGDTWYDRIILTPLFGFTSSSDVVYLANLSNVKGLNAGESYTNSTKVKMPAGFVGNQYLFVTTDQYYTGTIDLTPAGDTIPNPYTPSNDSTPYPYLQSSTTGSYYYNLNNIEETLERDNFFYRVINILSQPNPDLQVVWSHVPDTIDLTSQNTVRWWLKNTGFGNLNNRYVTDEITYNGTHVYTYNGYESIQAGDSVERTATIQLPCASDNVGSLSIVTDYSGIVDESNDTNNTANSHNFTITRPVMTDVAGLIPANDSVITHGNIVLRWNAVEDANRYNVFVWQNGQQFPSTPSYTTSVPNVIVNNYDNNSVYNWKVVAVNRCDTSTSPIQHFAIFKQPILTIDNPSIAFGEVEVDSSSQEYIRITGRDLTDSIRLSLYGADSYMFTLGQQAISRYGGSVSVSFTPTALKRNFDADVVVSSGTLHDTVHLSGLLANYYIFMASVPDSILPPVTPVPITGTLTNTADAPQANVPEDIWVSVMGRTSIITDTTDSEGHYGCTYTPVLSECGYYEVGACLHGDNSRTPLTTFNIPGISINVTSLPTWEVEQYDTVRGAIPVRNRCGVTLHNISVSGIVLPSGLNVVFDTLTLTPFQEDSLRYTLVGTSYSTGSRYENVRLACNSNEGSLSQLSLYYYCHKPVPNLQISFDSLFCSVVPGTQKVVDVALFNNTDSTFNNVQIQVPDGQSVIQLLQRDSAYSIKPHDSIYVHLLVSVPEDASWGIATGSMLVTADNTQPQYVPYTINPVSDATGSLMVLVSNEYTYYNDDRPHVSGATVEVIGYYNLDTVAIGLTGTDGLATFDSIPEGYYKIHVTAPENSGYTQITRIMAGEMTYLDIDLEFEAISYEWVAYQVGEEDEYELVLNTEFKTNVPKPVITIDIPVVDVPLDGSMGIFTFTVSNHGLIDSYDATIEMPQSSRYEYFPLFDRVDTLHALSSIVVPCGVRDKVIYDSVESIKNMGNYYIDTIWSISSHQQLRTNYSDSTISVPTGHYIDDSTGFEQWIYDTMLVTIPHYVTESVLDSSVSHVIYRESGTNEVLLDIDMNPLSNNNQSAKGVNRSTNKSKGWWVDCESNEVDKVAVATWYTCNMETRRPVAHQLIFFKWRGTVKKCFVDGIFAADTSGPGQYNYNGPTRELNDCPHLYGRLELCYGKREQRETNPPTVLEEGCKPCWKTIWTQAITDLPQAYIESALKCSALTAIDVWMGGVITPIVAFECNKIITRSLFILNELKKCADFSICIGTVDDCLSPKTKKMNLYNGEKTSSIVSATHNNSTKEEYERLMSIAAQYYYYQQSEWYRMVNDSLPIFETNPEVLSQLVYYLNTTDSATVEGLDSCYDHSVTVIDTNTLRQYADRWNRTITYSRYGWTNPSQELSGFSQDFYYPDTNNLIALANLRNAVEQEGFESVEELFVSTIEAMKNHKTKKSTCASVTLQFRQKVAMTREAFEGQLRINNPNDTAAIQGFMANFTVTDTLGHDYTDRFDIRIVSHDGVDSTGNIAANSSGTITVRFVPLMSAAPTEPIPYLFGGEISYINPFTSLPKSDELNPVRLTVNPSPHLQFDYFVPHDIIADDPLTSPVIETSVPATIGLRLLNDGKGVANNVRASSISPQITENRQGLVVDFSIIGTMLDGVNTTQPLNDIDLGTVNPNGVHTFEYSFMSSLLGTLTIKDIHVIHNSSIDDKDISLVDARAHRLVKPILQYDQGADAIHDFLTDDIGNGYNMPDSLFFSDGTQTVVHAADTTTFDHYVTPDDTIVVVTVYPDSIGWNYGESDDPGRGKYEIISCIRDDNTVIPLENIWLTFVDLPTDEDPVYVNKLHLADTLSVIRPTSYNVTFSLLPQTLNVDTILNVPSTPLDNPLDSVVVVFNKAIIDSTFSYKDMSLKCNNGVNLMDSTIVIGRINDSTFSVNVSQKNNAIGLYIFNVITDSIVDATGRYGNGGKSVQWVRTSCTPITVNESRIVCDSLSWNGSWLTNSGVYYDTLAGSLGCDTILALNLTVNNSSTGIETVSACNSFMWHNNEYTASTDTATFISDNTVGCDSVTTLHLTVNYSSTSIDQQTACDSYTWIDGNTYTVSNNTATYTTENAAGCDSVVTLNLTVNYTTSAVETITACNSYLWHGVEYTVSTNSPTYTCENASGCDSTTTLHLNINTCSTTEITACDSYTWHETTYTVSGTYFDGTDTLLLTINQSNSGIEIVASCDSYTWHGTEYTSSTNLPTFTCENTVGCDSVTTLYLTVNYSSTSIDQHTACDSYTWIDGNTYTASNSTTQYTLTNAAGCDSVVTLNLTLNYSNTGIDQQTACDSYTWTDGNTYTASNSTAQYTLTNVSGCDSVVTLNLTVNYSNTGIDQQTACDSYTWIDGNTYTASNSTAQYSLTNAAGCDSVVTLNLTVNYSYTGIDQQTACDGYTWIDGNTYTVSNNTATYTTENAAGCDSVVTLNLTVNYTTSAVETITACNSYLWHGVEYTASTNSPTYTCENASGCDSTTTLHLNINICSTTEITSCDSYTWHGTTYTASGTYYDGTDTLVLTINHSNASILTDTACDDFTWHDNTYTASGTLAYQTTNVAGCDSTVTLHLTVNYSSSAAETVTACNSYVWHGTEYTASTNTPTYITENVAGCDSVTTLHLVIIHCSTTEITACDSYTWHGTTYTASGTYYDGSDTLSLTINYSNAGTETVTTCDSYFWHGNTYVASNNTATYTTTNAAGCDSVTTLNLTINYSNTGDTTAVACDSYTWHGTTYTASGTLAYQTTNVAGCDSTVTLHLTVNYSNTGDTTALACDGFTWHGTTYTASGTLAYQTTNAAGCDSTVTLHLTVNQSTASEETVTACDNYTWHGTTYTASGTLAYQTTNVAGCDSTVTLHLTINQSTASEETVTACDSFTWHGTTYTASGTLAYQTTNAAGCDSTVTLHLTVNQSTASEETVTACDGFTWHGTTYTASGVFAYQTTNMAGCDSTVTLLLTINYSVDTTIADTAEGSYIWNGTTYTESGTYQWQGTTAEGCDSTVTLILVINSVGIEVIDGNGLVVNVYPNPTRGWITIDADDVLSVEVFDQTGRHIVTHDNTNRINLGGLATGNYVLRIHLQRGNSVQRVILK